jgi:hypothetical protein
MGEKKTDVVNTLLSIQSFALMQLSGCHFPPQTREHCSQEMLERTGNLDGKLSQISLSDKTLNFSTGLCLIPFLKVNI